VLFDSSMPGWSLDQYPELARDGGIIGCRL
jgi:hypothetical protein